MGCWCDLLFVLLQFHFYLEFLVLVVYSWKLCYFKYLCSIRLCYFFVTCISRVSVLA